MVDFLNREPQTACADTVMGDLVLAGPLQNSLKRDAAH